MKLKGLLCSPEVWLNQNGTQSKRIQKRGALRRQHRGYRIDGQIEVTYF